MKEQLLTSMLGSGKIAILGFGREGRSGFDTIRRLLPLAPICIADRNKQAVLPENLENTEVCLGENYLDCLSDADLILKSPGIPHFLLDELKLKARITSQTELFLGCYRNQTIGITGTKGKSTTASLLYHLLSSCGIPTQLLGNIGIPPFERMEQITPQTRIVFEMSSHQLERIGVSPHLAIFLNIFPEHLDHYKGFEGYLAAKMNIARWQQASDWLLYNPDNPHLEALESDGFAASRKLSLGRLTGQMPGACFSQDNLTVGLPTAPGEESPLKFEVFPKLMNHLNLPGKHNEINAAAAIAAALICGADPALIPSALETFTGLPHRLEYIGNSGNTRFYNDSISTVPESCMAALESLPDTQTLILGGYDRGLNYSGLMDYLATKRVKTLVFTGDAGKRMHHMALAHAGIKGRLLLFSEGFDGAFHLAAENTTGGVCLLSPAAASYNEFKDYSYRGERFRELFNQLIK